MLRYLISPFLILIISMCCGSAFGKNINYEILSKTGAETVIKYKMAHDEAIDSTGIGLFYGSDSQYGRGIEKFKLKAGEALLFEKFMQDFSLRDEGFGIPQEAEMAAADRAREECFGTLTSSPVSADCLKWCLLVLKESFEKSGAQEEWIKINGVALGRSRKFSLSELSEEDNVVGIELAKVLVESGWLALYYNPDTNLPADKPYIIPSAPESKKSSEYESWYKQYNGWEEHVFSYFVARRCRTYYGIPISDFIIDYRPTLYLIHELNDVGCYIPVDSPIPKRENKIKKLNEIPFGFLSARGGKHTALISYGKVYEVHRSLGPTKKDLIY